MRRSKTDQHGQGQHIAVWANPADLLLCPVIALNAWLTRRAQARDVDWSASKTMRRERPLFCAVTKAGRPTGAVLSAYSDAKQPVIPTEASH